MRTVYNAVMRSYDVCVQGLGIVGRALALSLAAQGWRVACVNDRRADGHAPHQPADNRAYALNHGSIELLRRLKVWSILESQSATRVTQMRVFGDGAGHLEFSAWQQQVSDLAWIVDAASIEQALAEAMRFANNVDMVDAPAPAALLAVCEGTHSSTRARLGVHYERHVYGHRAVAARVVSDTAHRGVAWQWFRSPDILALLPFDHPQPQCSYALVWSMPEPQAQTIMALADEDFLVQLNEAVAPPSHGASMPAVAGRLIGTTERTSWPLSLGQATAWCGSGWVLLGDAAHQVHPLSGQGLNLGLGDVRALSAVLQDVRSHEPWRNIGDERILRRYARERMVPTRLMAGVTDGMLNLFAAPSPWAAQLRNLGMNWVNRWAPAKRWMVDRALDVSQFH